MSLHHSERLSIELDGEIREFLVTGVSGIDLDPPRNLTEEGAFIALMAKNVRLANGIDPFHYGYFTSSVFRDAFKDLPRRAKITRGVDWASAETKTPFQEVTGVTIT